MARWVLPPSLHVPTPPNLSGLMNHVMAYHLLTSLRASQSNTSQCLVNVGPASQTMVQHLCLFPGRTNTVTAFDNTSKCWLDVGPVSQPGDQYHINRGATLCFA